MARNGEWKLSGREKMQKKGESFHYSIFLAPSPLSELLDHTTRQSELNLPKSVISFIAFSLQLFGNGTFAL